MSVSEERGRKQARIYSREFQAMLDGLDREECGDEETGPVGVDKKRRLSSNQVKALERNFEAVNKLEPERKAKLAEELGLQPRQVAIWFQNRRARYKTKQLEREYGILRSDYDSLKLDYDNLEQKKEALMAELRELKLKLHRENMGSHRSCYSVPAEESPVHDSVNDGSGAGSEPSEEIKEGYQTPNYADTQVEALVSSSSTLYNPPAAEILSWVQFSGQRSIRVDEQQQQQQQGLIVSEESCNFFSVDQAPALHWYFP